MMSAYERALILAAANALRKAAQNAESERRSRMWNEAADAVAELLNEPPVVVNVAEAAE